MSQPVEPVNPFAPPQFAFAEPEIAAGHGQVSKSRPWPVSLGIWSFVCIVSALPSFWWGIGTIAAKQAAAMAVGVLIFIVAYTVLDQYTAGSQWRRDRSLRMSLKIGYWTRLGISICYPIGAVVDVLCGMVSVGIAQEICGGQQFRMVTAGGEVEAGFFGVLLTTIIQGIMLNIVLAGYMLVVYALISAIRGWWGSGGRASRAAATMAD